MAAVDSAGMSAVIPAGYYTSQGYQSLSVSQQAAATGAQGLLDARQSLFSSLYSSPSAAAPTVLGVQINGASTPGQLAANSGEAALQSSQSTLLSTLSATSGWLPSSVFQLNLLQSLTRSGLLGYQQQVPTASQAAAQGAADQAANQQLLVDTLADPSSEESGTAQSAYLSGLYNRVNQYSLVANGSGVGGSLSFSA